MAAWTVLAPKDRGRSAAPIGAHPRSSSAASGHLLGYAHESAPANTLRMPRASLHETTRFHP